MRQQTNTSNSQYVVVSNCADDNYYTVLDALKTAIEDSPYDVPENIEPILDDFWDAHWEDKILFLAYDHDEVVGLLAACHVKHIIARDESQAVELVWWVRKDKRNTTLGKELLNAFEEWGDILNVDQYVLSHYHRDPIIGKLYQRKGYTPMEVSYIKRTKDASRN